ncbi:MAG: nucleotidyltransferase family protein [Clostridia bacterium]|nr:nucleotidyltransferase family protein [Clostridia bacterium]
MIMDKNEKVLLALIKSSLFNYTPDFPDDTDWQEVLNEARTQTVINIAVRSVPKEFLQGFEVYAAQSEAHFMRMLYEQTRLADLLSEEGIPFVIIKGTAAAIYYPVPSVRTMGDVDILVTEGRFEDAFSLLEKNGYEFVHDFGDGRDYRFTKGGVEFELHKRYSDKDFDIENYLINGIENAHTVAVYGNAFPALPDAENALVLLDHIRHHLFGGLGLRQIIDFMMCVNSVDEKTFETEILPLFAKARLDTLAKSIIKMCKMYLGLPKNADWCNDADDKTCEELLENVLSSGNFGIKSPYEYRPMQSLTMGIKENGLFKTLQRAGVENCALFKKYRLLRPFAWLYQAARYAKRGIIALFRGDTFAGDISSGSQKADFFKRLGIK